MGKKKHLLFIMALAAVMVFGLSAAAVHAEDPDSYFYTVGGVKYDPDYGFDAMQQEGWKYDPGTRTLTMDGMGSSGNPLAVTFAGFDLTVNLKNENTVPYIEHEYWYEEEYGTSRTLTIDGTGSLTVAGEVFYGIASETVLIKGGTVNTSGSSYGIDSYIVQIQGGTVNATGEFAGIFAQDKAEISGNAKVSIKDSSFGILANDTSIKGGTVTIDADQVGLGGGAEGFDNAVVNISGGMVSATGGYFGIIAEEINISGGDVYAKASDADYAYPAIIAGEAITISGRDTRVEAEGNGAGLVGSQITIADPLVIIMPEGGRVENMKEQDGMTAQRTYGQIVVDKDGKAAPHVVIQAMEYNITVQTPENGTAKADKTKAKPGDQVTITPQPASGYSVDRMIYTDASGKVTEIDASGSFTMPASDVTVNVTFKKNAAKLMATLKPSKQNGLQFRWKKVDGASGYDIFLSKCNVGEKVYNARKAGTVKGNSALRWKKTGLKKRTAYKGYVKAYVLENGQKKYIATSPLLHAFTNGGTKNYTNAKSVTVKKSKLSVSAGATAKIKAKVKKQKSGRKLMSTLHAPKLRYLSSDKGIAAVNGKGIVTGVGKGTCTIYVYAHNGIYKTISVTVR